MGIAASTAAIKTFKDLYAWKTGHQLVLLVYKVTVKFPTRVDYALFNQMKRAAVSITSNIAEGFSRRGRKEKAQFYSIALGSLTELQNQLLIATDVGYIDKNDAGELESLCLTTHKLLNGLIKATRLLPNS